MQTFAGSSPLSIRGPWAPPLVGPQLSFVRLVADPVGRSIALHRAFGDIVAAADKNPSLVVAFGAERNREVLSNQAAFDNDTELFFKAPPGSALEKFRYSLVFQAGAAHKRYRRLRMPAFHKAAIDGHARDIVEIAQGALDTWPVGLTADVAELTRQMVQFIAVRCFFGLDWREGDRGVGYLANHTVDLLTSPLSVALPLRIPGTPFARLLDASDELVGKFRALLEEKRAQRPIGHDVLSLLVHARDEDGSTLTEDELIGAAGEIFVAGHDTQARTLAWTLFLLEQHPKVLGDVLDEVQGVLRGGPPSVEHIPRLPLVDRVIKESMRVLPPVPMLFIRVCQHDARLGPYTLPAGSKVVLSPVVTHRDPSLYPEPARFKPERWERLQPTLYEYLPFGAGPRMCIGAAFATLSLRLLLPMILQRYRLRLAFGARISRRVRGNIMGFKHGLPMLIAPQDRRLERREGVRGDVRELVDLS